MKYSFLLFLVFFGCQSTEQITLTCIDNDTVELIPPPETFHLSLALIQSDKQGFLKLYAGDAVMDVLYEVADLRDNIVIYEGEWNEAPLKIESSLAENHSQACDIQLKATFYHNYNKD